MAPYTHHQERSFESIALGNVDNDAHATQLPTSNAPEEHIPYNPGKRWYRKLTGLISLLLLTMMFLLFMVIIIAALSLQRGGSVSGAPSEGAKSTDTATKTTAKPSTEAPAAPSKPGSSSQPKNKREDRFKRFYPYPQEGTNHTNIAIPTAGSYGNNGKVSIHGRELQNTAVPTATPTSHPETWSNKTAWGTANKQAMSGKSKDDNHNAKNKTHIPYSITSRQDDSVVHSTGGFKPVLQPNKQANPSAKGKKSTYEHTSDGTTVSSCKLSVVAVGVFVLGLSFATLL